MRLCGSNVSRGGTTGLNEETIREFLASDYRALVANLTLLTDSRDEAEDLVQEALVRAWIQSDKGQEIVALRAWVGVVAMNLARSRLRRVRVERRVTEMLSSHSRAAARWELGRPDREVAIDTRELVGRLPRRQREVVILHYYLDLGVGRTEGPPTGTSSCHLMVIGIEGPEEQSIIRDPSHICGADPSWGSGHS